MERNQFYIEGLHGLRFICAVLVLIFHCNDALSQMSNQLYSNFYFLNKGSNAVDFFFILSGFLITYLALIEWSKTNSFNIKKFMIKRIIRIFPLYYLAVILGFVLIGFLYPLIYRENIFEFSLYEGLMRYVLFMPNVIASEYSNVGPLRSLWSIGVEEQFYLLFSAIFLFERNRRFLFLTLFIGTVSIYFIAFYNIGFLGTKWISFFTKYFRIHFILWGCLIGFLHFYYANRLKEGVLTLKVSQLMVWTFFISLIFLPNSFDPHNFFAGFFFSLIILIFSSGKSIVDFELKYLVHLGSISYGIYIYHPYISIIYRYFISEFPLIKEIVYSFPIIFYLGVFCLTVVVADLSYRYFESYFYRFRE